MARLSKGPQQTQVPGTQAQSCFRRRYSSTTHPIRKQRRLQKNNEKTGTTVTKRPKQHAQATPPKPCQLSQVRHVFWPWVLLTLGCATLGRECKLIEFSTICPGAPCAIVGRRPPRTRACPARRGHQFCIHCEENTARARTADIINGHEGATAIMKLSRGKLCGRLCA